MWLLGGHHQLHAVSGWVVVVHVLYILFAFASIVIIFFQIWLTDDKPMGQLLRGVRSASVQYRRRFTPYRIR